MYFIITGLNLGTVVEEPIEDMEACTTSSNDPENDDSDDPLWEPGELKRKYEGVADDDTSTQKQYV